MRGRPLAILILAGLALTGGWPPSPIVSGPAWLGSVSAQGSSGATGTGGTVLWDYTVTVPSAPTGTVHVVVQIVNALGVVQEFSFDDHNATTPVYNFGPVSGTQMTYENGRHVLQVRAQVEAYSFDVGTNEEVGSTGQYYTYRGANWGLIKAESFSIPFSFTYTEGAEPTFDARVHFVLPTNWNATAPWSREATPQTFDLAPGQALPRGFVAVGPFSEQVYDEGGREVRYVRLGAPGTFEARMPNLLDLATPWQEHIYGNHPGPILLVISAPDPMLRGGLGGYDSMYVHESSDLRTVAHEFTHVWQRFGGLDDANDSSIWIPEGLAELDGTLSLLVTGDWTLGQVNQFFQGDAQNASVAPFSTTSLAHSTYENAAERVPYVKGALVLEYLDEQIQSCTRGRYGLPDVLQVVNANADAGPASASILTNEQFLATLNHVTSCNFTNLFQALVYGSGGPTSSSWPPGTESVAAGGSGPGHFEAVGHLVPVNLTIEPHVPVAGHNMTVQVTIDNRGLGSATKNFSLVIDGQAVNESMVALGIAGRVILSFTQTAPPAGAHNLTFGTISVAMPVQAPARLIPGNISSEPAAPVAGSVTNLIVGVANVGDFPATGVVALFVDGSGQGSQNVTVGAGATTDAVFPVTFGSPGFHNLTVRVYSADGTYARNATFPVAPAPQPGSDSVVGRIQKAIPNPGGVWVAGAIVSLAWVVRRSRRGAL
ncbi:MAG: hypothetical protein ACYDDF_03185 [Thermoplasmatota archaeon]